MAGNATMTHLVLGIDPEPLGMAPFIMSTRLFPEVLAADLGLTDAVHPRSRAVVFPAFGAYVGGDIMAGLLASGMDRDARVRLFVDIGTNCEIVLGNREWLLATAAPAGPAFEGAAIRCGMRAADGAIEVVTMTPEDLSLKVIGDAEPQGLCGSGLVDAVTGLVQVGLLDSSGRFIPEEEASLKAPGLGRPADDDRQGTGVRAALAGCPPRTASTCPSATSASCSSPRRRSPPAGRSCSRRPA